MAITSAIYIKYPHITNNKCGNTISHMAITSAKCGIISSTHTLIITSVKEKSNKKWHNICQKTKLLSIYPNKIIRVYQH